MPLADKQGGADGGGETRGQGAKAPQGGIQGDRADGAALYAGTDAGGAQDVVEHQTARHGMKRAAGEARERKAQEAEDDPTLAGISRDFAVTALKNRGATPEQKHRNLVALKDQYRARA